MMHKFILSIAFAFLCGSASAQTIEAFKAQLAQRDVSGGRVNVVEHGDAAQIVRSFNPGDPGRKVTGYRVVIFVDNSQGARENGNAALARFKELYPEMPAQMTYRNPDVKVTAGDIFLTSEEALMLWGRIRNVFDKAVKTREETTLSSFGRRF